MMSGEVPEDAWLQSNPQPTEDVFRLDIAGQKAAWKHFCREISHVSITLLLFIMKGRQGVAGACVAMTLPYPGKGKVRKEAPQSPADLPFFFPLSEFRSAKPALCSVPEENKRNGPLRIYLFVSPLMVSFQGNFVSHFSCC